MSYTSERARSLSAGDYIASGHKHLAIETVAASFFHLAPIFFGVANEQRALVLGVASLVGGGGEVRG